MKILLPVDGSRAAFAAVLHVEELARSGLPLEVLLLHVQPVFHRHIAQFSSRAARDALRAERSAWALAPAREALERARVRFEVVIERGPVAERIAAVAKRERVDEIVMGAGCHDDVMKRTGVPVTVLGYGRANRFERYAVPAGIAGLATLLLSAD
jgi:nucleotide-binding universal stress UspA family protein